MRIYDSRFTFVLAVLFAAACAGSEGDPDAAGGAADALDRITVSGAGLSTPESVLHDTVADLYIVSNIDGQPLEKDGNGFLSTMSPDGEIVDLRWIDGADEGVELDAPKGMAIVRDSLFVADIDCIRVFVRSTGEPAASYCFDGATFLNDIAVDDNGFLYVTDTGMQAGPEGLEPSGSAAIYQVDVSGARSALARGEDLGNPNGIGFGSRGLFVATFGSGELYQLNPDGSTNPVLNGPQLDGIVFTPLGGFYYSSWGDSAVHHVSNTGGRTTVVEGVESPADIGYDAGRERLLVPVFNANEVWIVDVAGGEM